MRAFWNTIEKIDTSSFRGLDRLDKWLGKDTYRERIEKAVEEVREPQRAIQFDK